MLGELIGSGRVDAILAAAGSGGSSIAAAVMAAVPVGLPKLLVSTMASVTWVPTSGPRTS